MSEYLSKEEIKQWRSSLEKITLEEYAARLGKKIEEDKPTNDLIDIVLHGKPVVSTSEDWVQPRTERISTIAQRAFEREQEIAPSPFSISKLKLSIASTDDVKPTKTVTDKEEKVEKAEIIKPAKTTKKATTTKKTTKTSATAKTVKTTKSKTTKKAASTKTAKAAKKEVLSTKSTGDALRDEVRVVFKKALTDREQKVFDHFAKNKNQIVYAKDLAAILELPRDYVYKYIKNLRAKIDGEKLQNADKGGFILHI